MDARPFFDKKGSLRFCLLFAVLVSVFYSLTSLQVVISHVDITTPVTSAVIKTTRLLVDLLGAPVRLENADLVTPGMRLRISDDCNGMIAFIIYMSAVLAFPSRWRDKGIGILMGAVLIWTLNILRILILVYVALYFPQFFFETHIYVAQSVVIAAGVVLWFFWAQSALRAADSTRPSTAA
ncbi:MAG: archaeosortase/exosortase family protein [Deltaproteobacteria bacterium]|nr:archaeosortase/exosortase family protein [Deltaproteobacteria bacterium]